MKTPKRFLLEHRPPNGFELDIWFEVMGDTVRVTQDSRGTLGVREPHVSTVSIEEARRTYVSFLCFGARPAADPPS